MASNTTNSGAVAGPTKKQVEEVVRAVFEESRSTINDTDRKKDPEWVDQLVDFVAKRREYLASSFLKGSLVDTTR